MYERWRRRIRNPKTRRIYSNWVMRFCNYHETEPESTLAWDLDTIEDNMWDFQAYLQSDYHRDMAERLGRDFEPLSGSTVRQAWNALRRWFGDHRLHIRVKPRDLRKGKTFFDYIPSKDELKLIIGQAKLKYQVAFSLIAYSGMRPSDVCGLKFKNIKASYVRGDEVLEIVSQQRKTGGWYVTFLGTEGTKYLRQLLELRKNGGEVLRDNSFVVSTTGKPLMTGTWRCYFNNHIKGISGKHPTGEPFRRFRLYGLRKYFRKNVGRTLDESEAEYLMGHVAGLKGLSGTYSGLGDMDLDAIKQLKQKYISALGNLEAEGRDLIGALKRELEKYISDAQMEELTHGLGGGKAVKAEWSAEMILSALTRALAE